MNRHLASDRPRVALVIAIGLTTSAAIMATTAFAGAPVFTITSPSVSVQTTSVDTMALTFSATSSSSPAILHQAWSIQDGETGATVAEAVFNGGSFSTTVTLDAEPRGKPYTLYVGGVNADTYAVESMTIECTRTLLKVLVLQGYPNERESSNLPSITGVGIYTFTYETVDINPSNFDGDMRDADILWMAGASSGVFNDYFMTAGEQTVLDFVAGGGVCWVSMTDDTPLDGDGDQVGGWMPIDDHPITVINEGDVDATPTAAGIASGLFSTPNTVDLDDLFLDDFWVNLDASWTILATRDDSGEAAVEYLPWGDGVYLHVCMNSWSAAAISAALPLMENGLTFLTDWINAL
ncbi:hypothetical protein CMK11_20875 [Candidatus Poribacteria bacterium]|nr:hypothetical protein [Candidatus Poribacteria bacterium]